MKLSKAIEGYAIDRIAEGYSQSTIDSYGCSLRLLAKFLHDPEIEQVTTDHLKSFFHYLRTEYKPKRMSKDVSPLTGAALHGKWKAVRSLWNWAEESLQIEPVAKAIKAPQYSSREINPFSHAEVSAMLAACEYTAAAQTSKRRSYKQRRPTARRDRAIVLLLVDTGIRVGECSRLQIQDVNFETSVVDILPFGQGKKTSGRIVPLGKRARRAVWNYLADRGEPARSESLFLTDKNEPITTNTIKKLVDHLGKRAQIHGAHPHRFRHTFAIEFLRNGNGNIYALQKILGHKSLEMVRRYLAIVEADVAVAHRIASPADNWQL